MNIELIENTARLSAIVESSNDAIISNKFDGTILSWNGGAEKVFGYNAIEAINNNISLIVPKELQEEETEILVRIKKGELIEHHETTRKTKDGHRVSIALTISPIKDKSGNIIGISNIARDISGQRLAEEKESMLAAIVNSSDDAIISKTLNGIITSWNTAAQKMFGYTEDEVIGKHISIIIPPDRLDEEKLIIQNIRNGVKIDHFETVRHGKDKKDIYISLTVSPIRNKKGEVIGASKVARDITEKVEAEKQRDLYTKKLQELNKYKDEFMAMASHELKTPLTIIKANLDIMLLQSPENKSNPFIQKTLYHVNRLDRLMNDLLDISKIQSGRLELNLANFDMTILLREIIQNVQPTTQIQITYNEKENSLWAHGDMERIGLVINNLLTNAIKYSPGSKIITVESFAENNKITVRISDNGIGIPREDLTNIFSRFYRVSGLSATFAGSGIGLYISSEIINRHGGDIWAESELGHSSTFYFSIPSAEVNSKG
jgi:PAS domain S-box-containing protein